MGKKKVRGYCVIPLVIAASFFAQSAFSMCEVTKEDQVEGKFVINTSETITLDCQKEGFDHKKPLELKKVKVPGCKVSLQKVDDTASEPLTYLVYFNDARCKKPLGSEVKLKLRSSANACCAHTQKQLMEYSWIGCVIPKDKSQKMFTDKLDVPCALDVKWLEVESRLSFK